MPAGSHRSRVAGKGSLVQPNRRAGKIPATPPPPTPPPLTALGGRRERLEAERIALFEPWAAALKAADGNVSKAAAMQIDPPMTRDRANQLTRRLGLVDYAAGLRRAATGHARGRQDR